MANCSIPNSIPGTGRTSTISLRRSKKQNSPAHSLLTPPHDLLELGAARLTFKSGVKPPHSKARAAREKFEAGCWTLGVGRFHFLGE